MVIGKGYDEDGSFELQFRATGEKQRIDAVALIDFLGETVEALRRERGVT